MPVPPSSPSANAAVDPLAVKKDAARFIVGMALAGLGVGAIGRAIPGIKETFAPPKPLPARGRGFRPVPVGADKQAASDALSTGMDYLSELVRKYVMPQKGWFAGDAATTPLGVPAAMAIGFPAAALGLAGGYKATDAILDWRRKGDRKAELEAAKQRFAGLLEGKTAETLDKLAEESLTKEAQDPAASPWPVSKLPASWQPAINNLGGGGVGLYLALASLAALGAGHVAYRATKSHSQRGVLEDAMRERTRTPAAVPLPFYTYPASRKYPPPA